MNLIIGIVIFLCIVGVINGVNNAQQHKYYRRKNNEYDNVVNMQQDNQVDEIRKYKELLDEGAITQEEFEEKKRKLLDL